jgi:endonuclease YncB( thermonuclease family)
MACIDDLPRAVQKMIRQWLRIFGWSVAMLIVLPAGASENPTAPTPTKGVVLTGTASVTDGDTLRVQDSRHGSVRVRLFGIDAPELDQTCHGPAGRWDCGKASRQQLETAIAGRRVDCRVEDRDRYGRAVATCSAGTADLNAEMVTKGLAVATPQYTKRYVNAESAARAAGAGIWAGSFQHPAEYRRDKRR